MYKNIQNLELLMEKNIEEFIAHFNQGDFFKAHEVLEELWQKTIGVNRDAIQGLIQLAVALHHAQHKNEKGAFYEHNLAKKKLENYPPLLFGINLQKLLSDAEIFFQQYPFQLQSPPTIQTIK